jgi:hypothetical protein
MTSVRRSDLFWFFQKLFLSPLKISQNKTRTILITCQSILFFAILGNMNTYCQKPAPPIDNAPFQKPVYFSLIKTKNTNIDEVLDSIAGRVIKAGYEVIARNVKEQQIEAEKKDSRNNDSYDRIIVWIERDFEKPNEIIKVYLLCGHFEYILGAESKIYRIKINDIEENQRFNAVKKEIRSIIKVN